MKMIGKYEMIEEIGSGSMGTIWRGRDSILDRPVALKTLKGLGAEIDPTLRERFYREARACAKLQHPNIVLVYDLIEEAGTISIAMELLEGQDMRRLIRQKPVVPLIRKLEWMAEVCDGLEHAHRLGLVHRDIKPSNIFLCTSGRIKVLDFGIARLPTSQLTVAGEVLGSPNYMAPEQIRRQPCDERSDMFSAGIVFCELLTYAHPFDSKFIPGRIVESPPDSLRTRVPEVPEALEALLFRVLAKDPAARVATAGELARSLRSIAEEIRSRGEGTGQASAISAEEWRAAEIVRLTGEFDAALARKSASACLRVISEMQKIDTDRIFAEAIADCESRLKSMIGPAAPAVPGAAPAKPAAPAAEPAGPATVRPPSVSSAPRPAAAKSMRGIYVSVGVAAVVLAAGAYFLSLRRAPPPAAGAPAAAVGQATARVDSVLLAEPREGASTVAKVSRGSALSLLELPASRSQLFVHAREPGGAAGYARIAELVDWNAVQPSASLRLMRLFAPGVDAGRAEWQSFATRLEAFAARVPGTTEAGEALLEAARGYSLLARRSKETGGAEEDRNHLIAQAEKALAGADVSPSLKQQTDAVRRELAAMSAAVKPAAMTALPPDQLLKRIPPLWEQGEYTQALRLVNEVLTAAPDNRDALTWKEKIRKAQEAEKKAQ